MNKKIGFLLIVCHFAACSKKHELDITVRGVPYSGVENRLEIVPPNYVGNYMLTGCIGCDLIIRSPSDVDVKPKSSSFFGIEYYDKKKDLFDTVMFLASQVPQPKILLKETKCWHASKNPKYCIKKISLNTPEIAPDANYTVYSCTSELLDSNKNLVYNERQLGTYFSTRFREGIDTISYPFYIRIDSLQYYNPDYTKGFIYNVLTRFDDPKLKKRNKTN